MTYISSQIQKEAASRGLSDQIHVIAPECNHYKTGDDIKEQATRIAAEIKGWLEVHPEPVQVSFVCHSMGGLKARLVISMLDPLPSLNHYISIATPHLGTSYASSVYSAAPTGLISLVAGTVGSQLFLRDPERLIVKMGTLDEYMKPLKSFKSRTAYSCVARDLSVGFETAAIRADNPCLGRWGKDGNNVRSYAVFLNSIPGLGSKNTTQPRLEDISALESSYPTEGTDPDGHVKAMLDGLNSMEWTRVAIYPSRPALGHVDCIVSNELLNVSFGDSVVQDVVKRLFA
ncbi:UNVERIFIED_CONTAM: hypothetical protein HDU68_002784 [Siphonaria sp. JEL0065]|nr:hypothetical protein HDU68_002784 [Siphonaria sp. JEL0065]